MLKKYGILILLLLLCLSGCAVGSEQAAETTENNTDEMYYHTGEALWRITREGAAEKLSEEYCSVCVNGVVYELFGNGSILAKDAGEQDETWGLRVDGQVIYEEPYYFEDRNDLRPLTAPLLLTDELHVVGEYIYFSVVRKDEAGARLCRLYIDGSDLEIYEDFLIAPDSLLSDGNTVFFRLLTEETTIGYPGRLEQSSQEAEVLTESIPDIAGAFWIATGKLWWLTSTEEAFVYNLYSARALGGETEEYPEFTDTRVWTVSGSSVYYQKDQDLYAWDFTSRETSVYPGCLTENRGLVKVRQWGGLLVDTTEEAPVYWLLDFDTGALTQVLLE